jgi:hypothetical protein
MYPHWLRHRRSRSAPVTSLIRSAPSRPADVAVAHNYLPPSCATDRACALALTPVCRAPCFAFDDFPFTVGDDDEIRPAADENTTLET